MQRDVITHCVVCMLSVVVCSPCVCRISTQDASAVLTERSQVCPLVPPVYPSTHHVGGGGVDSSTF